MGYWPRDAEAAVHRSYEWNYMLWCLFAIQHSGMQRRTFWKLPAHVERSAYVAASGIVLAIVTILWQPLPGDVIWEGPTWIVAISVLGMVGILWCGRWFDHNTFFGLRQAWTRNADVHGPLIIAGPYRYVRHPLMLAFLITIWSQPIMPPELLMMNIGMTIYIWFGTQLEEISLAREFGADYEAYRKKVAALIPWVV
jgi:protein-S-isoprenylcysteine O-methyltransferase Ste14